MKKAEWKDITNYRKRTIEAMDDAPDGWSIQLSPTQKITIFAGSQYPWTAECFGTVSANITFLESTELKDAKEEALDLIEKKAEYFLNCIEAYRDE